MVGPSRWARGGGGTCDLVGLFTFYEWTFVAPLKQFWMLLLLHHTRTAHVTTRRPNGAAAGGIYANPSQCDCIHGRGECAPALVDAERCEDSCNNLVSMACGAGRSRSCTQEP